MGQMPAFDRKLAIEPGRHDDVVGITGPVYVRGAAVGGALQIEILDVKVRQDRGFVSILPLLGTLPDEFTEYETIHPRIDRPRNVCIMPWGSEIPLEPFFGIIATASPPSWGRCGSPVPRAFGGNMDNKELRAGTMLYLPVFNEDALFFAGDGHAVQGDGEVCITALETGVTGTFRLTVRKDTEIRWPFAESATPFDVDRLDDAAKRAVREMVRHVCARTNLMRNAAYMLSSLAGNLCVTQLVDGNKGIHMLLRKTLL
jgi:acetamidase/formamidase